MLSSYTHETLLKPLTTKLEEKELKPTFELSQDEEIDVEALLKENSLSKLTSYTNCLTGKSEKLGFKYQVRKKSYYVDTHEKPENQWYRMKFIRRY
jgi:hypothetical protein